MDDSYFPSWNLINTVSGSSHSDDPQIQDGIRRLHQWLDPRKADFRVELKGEVSKYANKHNANRDHLLDLEPPELADAIIPKPTAGRKLTINERMKATINERPEAKDWSVTEWATYLNCSRAGIHETETWQELQGLREVKRVGLIKDRHHRTNGR